MIDGSGRAVDTTGGSVPGGESALAVSEALPLYGFN